MKGIAILIGDKWYDFSSIIRIMNKNEEEKTDEEIAEEIVSMLSPFVDILTTKDNAAPEDKNDFTMDAKNNDDANTLNDLIYNLREIADALENKKEIVITRTVVPERLSVDGLENVSAVE